MPEETETMLSEGTGRLSETWGVEEETQDLVRESVGVPVALKIFNFAWGCSLLLQSGLRQANARWEREAPIAAYTPYDFGVAKKPN